MRTAAERTRVLLVDDDLDYVQAARNIFLEADEAAYELEVNVRLSAARASIAASPPDVVIVSTTLSDGLGKELIPTTDDKWLYPVVVISSVNDEPLAVDAIHAGAWACVEKSLAALIHLPHVVHEARSEWRHVRAIQDLEIRLRRKEQECGDILDAVSDLVLFLSHTGDLHDCRGDFRRFGVDDPTLLVGKNLFDLVRGQLRDSLSGMLSEADGSKTPRAIPLEINLADSPRYVEARVVPLSSNSALAILRDVTETMMYSVTRRALTRSEQAVLRLVTEGKSNKQVSQALNISLKAVETRRARVMSKLDVQNLVELMRLVLTGHRYPGEHGSRSPA